MVFNVHRNHNAYWEGGGGTEVGEDGDYIHIATLSPPVTRALRWAITADVDT